MMLHVPGALSALHSTLSCSSSAEQQDGDETVAATSIKQEVVVESFMIIFAEVDLLLANFKNAFAE